MNSWTSANQAAQPGDRVVVDGSWTLTSLFVFTASGSPGSPITITTFDANAPAKVSGSLAGLFYVAGSNVKVELLHLADDAGSCLMVKGDLAPAGNLNSVEISAVVFEQCNNGISVSEAANVEVHDCSLSNIGSNVDNLGHCLYVAQGANHVELYRNTCRARSDVYRSHCFHVYHSEAPGPANDVRYHDNVCIGFTTGAGVYSGSTSVVITNNTFVVQQDEGFRCNYGGSQATIANNIVIGSASYGATSEDAACDVDFHDNIYFSTGPSDFAFLTTSGSSDFAGWQAQGEDSGSIAADPKVADAPNGDVHLASDSPAIDTGDDALAAVTDYYGMPRIQGAHVDIGASEFGSGAGGGAGSAGAAAGGGSAGDASVGTGGSSSLDAGAGTGGVAHADSGAGASAAPGSDSSGGCGCRTPNQGPTGSGTPFVLVAAWLALTRRRARRAATGADRRCKPQSFPPLMCR